MVIFGLVINFEFEAKEPVEEPEVTPEPIETALPNPYVERLLDDYEAELLDMLEKTRTPGLAVAIVQDSTILFMKTYGVREVGKTDSIDIHSVFRLASVSKCFAPLLTGILVENNLLQWDDRVVQYLPDFELKSKEHSDSLRLTHVLSHTTGLPYHTYTTLVEDGMDLPSMIREERQHRRRSRRDVQLPKCCLQYHRRSDKGTNGQNVRTTHAGESVYAARYA
jgi:beta-lactamase class C